MNGRCTYTSPTTTAKGVNSKRTGSNRTGRETALQGAGEHRLRTEDDHPGVDADEKVAPERQDHQQHQQVAVCAWGCARSALPEDRRSPGTRPVVITAYQKDLRNSSRVQGIGEEALIVLEREIDDALPVIALLQQRRQPAEIARVAERGHHHDQRGDGEEQNR